MSGHSEQRIAAVILAAGKGTRMKSELPKVLHPLAGRPMVVHVMDTVLGLKHLEKAILVIGEDMQHVHGAVVKSSKPSFKKNIEAAIQKERLGTGDAVKAALPNLKGFEGVALIMVGDAPLIQTKTLQKMVDALDAKRNVHVSILGFRPADPAEYGRLVVSPQGELEQIVEYKDATPQQRNNNLCNSGIVAVSSTVLEPLLQSITNQNAKGEYYLTDIVAIARSKGYSCSFALADEHEVMGVNSRAQLAEAEGAIQKRLRLAAMEAGVTLVHPESVFLCADTVLGQDIVIHPNVVFGPGVSVGDNVEIRSFCHIEGAKIAKDAIIGPFARIRPGTVIGEESRIGNFVEIKNAQVHKGAKISHLSYVGDASVGMNSNIGAGTITCNYDGFNKFHTDIGKDCFIGSNTCLVAPVKIGDGAIIGAGSTITSDVDSNAMGLARATQTNLENKAKTFKEKRRKKEG